MRVHVYADNVGEGSTAFQNVHMRGEIVVKKDKKEIDKVLSIREYPNQGIPREYVTGDVHISGIDHQMLITSYYT